MAVRQTFSKFKATGRLKDKKLEIVKGKFDDGVDFNTIRGRFVIGVGNGEYTCEVYMRDKFAASDHKTNSDYENIVELQNCALDTPIEVRIRTDRFNDYVGKSGKVVSVDCFNAQGVKILSEPASEEKFEGMIEGMLNKEILIASVSLFLLGFGICMAVSTFFMYREGEQENEALREYVNEEETGRLKVEITGVGYNEKALPHQLYVPEDSADQFNSIYEVGALASFSVEIKSVEYGVQKTESTGGFGRRADVNTGFTRVEWIVIGGEKPIDEERVDNKGEKLYIDPKEIKRLLEERSIELEQILKESKNKTPKAKAKPSFKDMNKASMAGNNPFDVGENPFL